MAVVSRRVTLVHNGTPVTRTVEFAQLGDGLWSSDALFAVRYGDGETIYQRALVLDTFPASEALTVGAADFAPFRELAPELLGWVDRPALGSRGIPGTAAPENSDRDAVRLARLVEAHVPVYYADDADEPLPRGVGDRCVFCGADTGPGTERHARRRRASATADLAAWLPAAERSSTALLIGWSCSPCETPTAETACACPVCPDCEDHADPAAGSRCTDCANACPPYFAPAGAPAPAAFTPIAGVHLHGRLEDRAGTDALVAIDGARLADWLLAGSMRIAAEAYLLLGRDQVAATLLLWRRGPDEVRGLLVDAEDADALAYAEARAAERSDTL